MTGKNVQVNVSWGDLLTILAMAKVYYSLIPETTKNGDLKVHLSLRRD